MSLDVNIFGAKASVHLSFAGTIYEIAKLLEHGLSLRSFEIETSEYPPHALIGTSETLGCELWLEAISDKQPPTYSLSLETSESFTEIANNRMHDLSPWLARYLTDVCQIKAVVGPPAR